MAIIFYLNIVTVRIKVVKLSVCIYSLYRWKVFWDLKETFAEIFFI